jgi:hypothetical protein
VRRIRGVSGSSPAGDRQFQSVCPSRRVTEYFSKYATAASDLIRLELSPHFSFQATVLLHLIQLPDRYDTRLSWHFAITVGNWLSWFGKRDDVHKNFRIYYFRVLPVSTT